MKYAIISDIHGNLIALKAVLQQLDREGVDGVVCLGDVAATGPQPSECIGELRTRSIPTVMGNADAWLLDPVRDPQADDFLRFIEEIDLWCVEQLGATALTAIGAFVPSLEIALPHDVLLAFHGSPRSYDEVLLATTPDERLADALSSSHATILAGGHTHQQLIRRFRKSVLVNPGSVGLGYERERLSNEPINVGWAEYAIIRQDDVDLSIELQRMAYDVDRLRRVARASGMPHADRWISGWS